MSVRQERLTSDEIGPLDLDALDAISDAAQAEAIDSRVPPHDLEAEAAVLSAAMNDRASFDSVAEFLRAEHFFAEAHRRMFEACTDLAARGISPDVVTVASWLRDRDRLAQVGGMAYITTVINAAPALANVVAYGKTVQAKWRLRQLIQTCRRVEAQVHAGCGDVESFIVAAQTQVAELISAPKPAGPLTLLAGEQLWAPLEPPDYLVDGLLVRGSLVLLVAYGASLKTWLEIDLAIATATGTAWMGRFATKRGRALLVDFESGSYEIRRRLHRDAAGRGLSIPIDGISVVAMPSLNLAEEPFFEALRPLAETHAFIAIDSLAAGSAGIDENDSRFAASLQKLKALAATTGCVILVIHHARKGAEDGDERQMVRGTSAIFNACDVVLQLARRDDGAFACKQSKARGGKAVEPFEVRVDDVGADGSVVVATDSASADEARETEAVDRFTETKAKVLRLLAAERDLRSATEIYRRTRGTKKVVLDAVKELEERRTITKHEGTYRLTSEVQT